MEFHREGAADVFKGYDDLAFFTASEEVCVVFSARLFQQERWRVQSDSIDMAGDLAACRLYPFRWLRCIPKDRGRERRG